MSARETIENLWDRATPVAPLLDAYRAEVLREAAQRIRDARPGSALGHVQFTLNEAASFVADLIDPDIL